MSETSEIVIAGFVIFIFACLRYLIMTGAYYFVVCKILDRTLFKFKIDPELCDARIMKHEMKWGLLNCINFFFLGAFTYYLYKNGHLAVYTDINDYGFIYAIVIIPISLVLLDTYFYWAHYMMHHSSSRRFLHHSTHHVARNVSPWSAFSVHPVEGFVEILSRPLLLALVPMHPYSILGFLLISFGLNIIGHSGYEFFPANYARSKFTFFKSCATFHYMHHLDGRYNLSLFFNWWDRINGTLHPQYEQFYDEVVRKRADQLHPRILENIEHMRTHV